VSGNNNVGLGGQVLGASGAGTSSAQNAALGTRALKNVTTGGDNTGVGYQAGQTVSTGAQNTLVGSGADVGSGSLSNTLGLGYNAQPTASNEAALGPYLNELTLHQLSSTSTDRPAAEIDWVFATATDASRKGRLSLGAHDALTSVGGPREGVRVESDGTQALLGFYGVTAVARAVLATGAGHTVDDVITALQNLGLVKQS